MSYYAKIELFIYRPQSHRPTVTTSLEDQSRMVCSVGNGTKSSAQVQSLLHEKQVTCSAKLHTNAM